MLKYLVKILKIFTIKKIYTLSFILSVFHVEISSKVIKDLKPANKHVISFTLSTFNFEKSDKDIKKVESKPTSSGNHKSIEINITK